MAQSLGPTRLGHPGIHSVPTVCCVIMVDIILNACGDMETHVNMFAESQSSRGATMYVTQGPGILSAM